MERGMLPNNVSTSTGTVDANRRTRLGDGPISQSLAISENGYAQGCQERYYVRALRPLDCGKRLPDRADKRTLPGQALCGDAADSKRRSVTNVCGVAGFVHPSDPLLLLQTQQSCGIRFHHEVNVRLRHTLFAKAGDHVLHCIGMRHVGMLAKVG